MAKPRGTYEKVEEPLRLALVQAMKNAGLKWDGLEAEVNRHGRAKYGEAFKPIKRQTIKRVLDASDKQHVESCYFLPLLREALGVREDTKWVTTFRTEDIELLEILADLRSFDRSQSVADLLAQARRLHKEAQEDMQRKLDALKARTGPGEKH